MSYSIRHTLIAVRYLCLEANRATASLAITICGETAMRINHLYLAGRFHIARPSPFPPSSCPPVQILSHLIRRTSISLDLQSLPQLAFRRTLVPRISLLLSLSFTRSLFFYPSSSLSPKHLEDRVRKCVSGMMHGGRDQKGRQWGKKRRRRRRACRRRRGGTSYGNEEMQW